MKSLRENIVLAKMVVARTGISRVIVKAGKGFIHQSASTYQGKIELIVFKKGTKVIVTDNKGKSIDEMETKPKEAEPIEVVEKPEVKKKAKKKSSDS